MNSSYNKVLLATDLTPVSATLVSSLFALCPDTDTEVVATHVVDDDPDPHSSEYLAAQAKLAELETDLRCAGYDRVKTVIAQGEPDEAVKAMADEQDFDLVLTASHGKTFLESALLGSTSFDLAKVTTCPLFVQKQYREEGVEPLPLFSRVLIPTDFSRNSLQALSVVRAFSESIDEVILAHVIEKSRGKFAQKKEQAEEKLLELVEELKVFGIKATPIIEKGTASKHLRAIAEKRDVSLTIICKAGAGLTEDQLGSTVENFGLSTDRPLLLLPTEDDMDDN